MASDAVTEDAADSVTGSSTEGDEPGTRRPRRSPRALAARGVLALALLLSGLCVSIVIGCFINDRTIAESRGQAVAEVLDASLTRTVVRFSDAEGRVYIPPAGVLYPSGLQQGQLVRVEYDSRNPDLVRVMGRTAVLSLLPVGGTLAGIWVVLLPTYLLLRRR
ncbi:DUF3592 domain-containing protein [Saccharopolyspora taberi]|uniref:DUF3592 domain-containing protein n=1 Tax=Saccharopolyspora taberi TaxID=60895 RepID=UPI0031DE2B72